MADSFDGCSMAPVVGAIAFQRHDMLRWYVRKQRKIDAMSSMRRVYLDNNASTPVLPQVLEAMRPYFGETFGNASSIHHHGQETRAAVERARDSVARLFCCRASEVVFTSGRTEGDNLAIAGVVKAGDHVITSR